ncbi:MAG: recombinase family protein [Deltaproteobacteria bacterium]|nr:recombinase family protein [Deltaproteobacteria bacterium]
MKTTRVALYARVSTAEQAEHGVSLSEQKERLQAWAKLEGWEIAGVYADEGFSGGTDDRPELRRLLIDARAGLFDIVAVSKLDRFFRNTRLLLNTIYQLEKYGVGLRAQADGIDTTSNTGIGKVTLNLLGSFAEWERERIGSRIKDFRNHLACKGRWSSGRTLFGYRFNRETKELEINQPEAEAIQFAFELFTQPEPIGILKLADIMNQRGYLSPRTHRNNQLMNCWTQTTARHVITHPAYKGGPNDDYKFKCPPIVTEQVWSEAQRRLRSNRHFRDTESRSPYQGLFRCGLCGHTLRIGFNHNSFKVWECPGRLKRLHLDGSPRCTLPRFKTDKLETKIEDEVIRFYNEPETFEKYIADTIKNLEKESYELERRLRPIQKQIDRILSQLQKADTMYELGRLSTDDYKARVVGLNSKLNELNNQSNDADPLMLRQLNDINRDIQYYQGMRKFRDFIDFIIPDYDTIKAGLSEETGEVNTREPENLFSDVFQTVPDNFLSHPEEATSKLMRELGLMAFIYPNRIELKGNVRQTNFSPDCRSGRYPRFPQRGVSEGPAIP